MKAGLRLGVGIWAAVLALASAAAPAQQVSQPETSTSAPAGTVGPRELQNFQLQGNVTRPAEQPAAPRQASPATRTQSPTTQNVVQSVAGVPAQERAQPAPARRTPVSAEARRREPSSDRSATAERGAAAAPEPLRQTRSASSVTVSLPRLDEGATRGSAAAAVPAAATDLEPAGTLAAEPRLSIFPWLLAALALGAGGAFLLWRNRSREAFAGAPQIDAFAAPEPAPAPDPTPAPRAQPKPPPAPVNRRPEPSITGIVSTRLRPWLEIGLKPTACLVEERQVTFEFEVELVNSGNAPAREVLVEASLFNASNDQDQQLEAFFANPVAQGERLSGIQPLKRIRIPSKVVTGREHVRVYEIRGRKVFVPIIAFNALYRWRSGEGQTSASYLLGIDTKREKLAPFRVDLGPRLFSAVDARPLPTGVRR